MSYPLAAVVAAVHEHLETTHISYTYENRLFSFSVGLDRSLSSVQMRIHCSPDHIIIHAISPLSACQPVRDRVMSFITYANYGMQRGNFEMDLDNGDIRYKNTYFFGENGPSEIELFTAISIPMMMMKKYGDGLIQVLFCNADPLIALKACEL